MALRGGGRSGLTDEVTETDDGVDDDTVEAAVAADFVAVGESVAELLFCVVFGGLKK